MNKSWVVAGAIVLVLLVAGSFFLLNQTSPPVQKDLAPRKTVADYFVEHMRVSADEANTMASNGVILRLSKNSTLQGVVGNLYYYGFIDDEAKFSKLLETAADTTPGKDDSIKAGKNTIDVSSNYYLNYSLGDEEIADTLLNKPTFEPTFTQYNYLFMPGGPNPS